MKIGSLFSGIGGLELGLERARLGEVAWQVERDAYCRHVLAKHWPSAQRFDDVRTVGAHNLAPVDVLCGGFPCQDLSAAGKLAGLGGDRSGLWFEMRRIIDELRPTWVVVENVAHTWRRYAERIAALQRDAEMAAAAENANAADLRAARERIAALEALVQEARVTLGRVQATLEALPSPAAPPVAGPAEAIQWDGTPEALAAIRQWHPPAYVAEADPHVLRMPEADGYVSLSVGDWVARKANGQLSVILPRTGGAS